MIQYVTQGVGQAILFGLSTDTKPSSPPDAQLFIETDTALIYTAISGSWVIKTTGSNLVLSDTTTNDSNTTRHGFLRKLDGLTTTFLRGDGAWAAPTGGSGDVIGPASVTDDLPAIFDGTTGKLIKQKTYAAFKTLLALVKGDVGLGNVDNTTDANKPISTATQTALDGKQPLDSDLTTIAGLVATTDNFIQSKASAWASRTVAQVKTDLGLTGTNSGDQTITLTGDVTGSGTGSFATTFKTSPSFTTPIIGVATGTSLATTGALTSSGGGIGYVTGAGGTVTQLTSRSTTVVLNKLCGNITMFSAAQAANAIITFTLTNSFIAATDYLLVQHISATNGGAWVFSTVCGAGSATISIANSTAASITSATPLRFTLIKGATS